MLRRDCQTGGENDRLGAGAYRGSRRRVRHSISAVGAKIPYTKKRPLARGHRVASATGPTAAVAFSAGGDGGRRSPEHPHMA